MDGGLGLPWSPSARAAPQGAVDAAFLGSAGLMDDLLGTGGSAGDPFAGLGQAAPPAAAAMSPDFQNWGTAASATGRGEFAAGFLWFDASPGSYGGGSRAGVMAGGGATAAAEASRRQAAAGVQQALPQMQPMQYSQALPQPQAAAQALPQGLQQQGLPFAPQQPFMQSTAGMPSFQQQTMTLPSQPMQVQLPAHALQTQGLAGALPSQTLSSTMPSATMPLPAAPLVPLGNLCAANNLQLWHAYAARASAIRDERAAAVQAVQRAAGPPVPALPGAVTPASLPAATLNGMMSRYLSLFDAAGKLSTLRDAEFVAMLQLMGRVGAIFAPIQKVRLVAACYPCFPDIVQVVRLLASEQQQPPQLPEAAGLAAIKSE